MKEFKFIEGSKELLQEVKPLWEKLNKYHQEKSTKFSYQFENNNFELRKSKFINNKELEVKIILIKDVEEDKYIAYSIATLTKDLVGEVDSLYIDKEYRGYGLGDKLMKTSLEYLDKNNAKNILIGVAEGNEEVLNFYERYGFFKRRLVLERIK